MKNKTIIAVAAVGFMSVVSLIAMSSLQPNPKSVEMLETKMGQPGFVSSKQQTAVKNGKKKVSEAVEKKSKVLKNKADKTTKQPTKQAQKKAEKAKREVKKTTSKKLDLNSNVCPCLNKPKPKPPVVSNKVEAFNRRPL